MLGTLLDNEKRMSQPGNVGTALINSSNYEMKLDANARERLNGRDCLVLDITPRRSSQYLFNGKLWVDAQDFAIVQLKGTASKSAFFLASAAEVIRQYDEDERTADGNACRGAFQAAHYWARRWSRSTTRTISLIWRPAMKWTEKGPGVKGVDPELPARPDCKNG